MCRRPITVCACVRACTCERNVSLCTLVITTNSTNCYDRAHLPSIICLGRLRIASKYIFNLWQLRQRVDSLAQWLQYWIFNREVRVRIPPEAGNFFSYASFLCYGFHVVRWGLVRDWTLYAENGFTSSKMMTSLKRGSVTTEHTYLRLSALAVSIYSISDNCVRESTLWLSG